MHGRAGRGWHHSKPGVREGAGERRSGLAESASEPNLSLSVFPLQWELKGPFQANFCVYTSPSPLTLSLLRNHVF